MLGGSTEAGAGAAEGLGSWNAARCFASVSDELKCVSQTAQKNTSSSDIFTRGT